MALIQLLGGGVASYGEQKLNFFFNGGDDVNGNEVLLDMSIAPISDITGGVTQNLTKKFLGKILMNKPQLDALEVQKSVKDQYKKQIKSLGLSNRQANKLANKMLDAAVKTEAEFIGVKTFINDKMVQIVGFTTSEIVSEKISDAADKSGTDLNKKED